MRLDRVFPGPPTPLLRAANPFDDWNAFLDAVDAAPPHPFSSTFLAEATALAASLASRAETGDILRDPSHPVDSVDVGHRVDPVDSVDVGRRIDPVDSVDGERRIDSVDGRRSVDPDDTARPIDPIESDHPADPHRPDDPADGAPRVVFAGQQAYVDYRLGMAAKAEALGHARTPTLCALVEYDTWASDPELTHTALARVDARNPDPLLPLRFHTGKRTHGRKDMRHVPPPDRAALDRIHADLRGTLTLAGRALPAFDVAAARGRLDALWADYAFAAERARSAGDFNLLWTVRAFRRTGLRAPLVPLGELWASDAMAGVIADTLVPLLRENDAFVAAANEAIALAAPHDAGMGPRPPGHVPLSFTDETTGIRAGLRVVRRGVDHVLESAGGPPFAESLGRAGADEVRAFLHRHRGRVTPNVFAPVFLARAGVAGVLNGRGAIRYALVVAHVLRRVFGLPHPPNFLCAGDAPADDRFAAARVAAGGSPTDAEPTLLARLLAAPPSALRAEIGATWR